MLIQALFDCLRPCDMEYGETTGLRQCKDNPPEIPEITTKSPPKIPAILIIEFEVKSASQSKISGFSF